MMNKKNSLINLGCRLNIYEGEIIKNHIKNNNIKNVTVINSCAVTAEAEKKVAYEIRKAKRINPENKIIVTGCAAQINPKKYHTLKEVDLVLGNKEKTFSDVWSDLKFSKPIHV
ncbi:MAG: tRNA (N(6)-L-threonylcarbamoyladenosine(37)-C(2))-methylthiotransferase MtaB, partial [Pelagibacterales bacterium]|nr:tRNA (N(6)-L-threonylcarbamoyladenosine(37)-C(2))-methylthiotransferase MtaB [Pelagibacterales bacterium]